MMSLRRQATNDGDDDAHATKEGREGERERLLAHSLKEGGRERQQVAGTAAAILLLPFLPSLPPSLPPPLP